MTMKRTPADCTEYLLSDIVLLPLRTGETAQPSALELHLIPSHPDHKLAS